MLCLVSQHVGVLRWKLRIRLDITKIKSFILITVPKVEKFDVTITGKEVPSTVDKFISIKIAPDTFESGTVNLEVIVTAFLKHILHYISYNVCVDNIKLKI